MGETKTPQEETLPFPGERWRAHDGVLGQWGRGITAYTLAFGGLLLFGGRIADLAGRKTAFMIGLLGFAAASALGGAATGQGMLFGARALQGVFAALLAPSALSPLATTQVFAAGCPGCPVRCDTSVRSGAVDHGGHGQG